MRMWNLPPEKMCDRHLLGEHVELHMIVGCLNKNKNIKGFLDKGFIEIHNIKKRHNELVKEMKNRGFKHNSPLQKFKSFKAGRINKSQNKKDLTKRCKNCRNLFKNT